MTKTIICCVAGIALAYVWGYQRGVAAGASQSTSGPIIGGGTDWLSWQGQ